jgi:CrtC N-terminal lipocalin domain/Lipocalin-like domain
MAGSLNQRAQIGTELNEKSGLPAFPPSCCIPAVSAAYSQKIQNGARAKLCNVAAMPNPPPFDVWPYHRPGSAVVFPRDEGWHRLLPGRIANPALNEMEWVYLNAHVTEQGGAGRTFSVFGAYFTQGVRFLVVRVFDAQDRYLASHTGSAWGLLRASPEKLDLTFRHGGGSDSWKTDSDANGNPVPFSSRLEALDDAGHFSVSLALKNQKRPYEAGGKGYLPFGRRGAFYYYSLTRVAVSGTLELEKPGGGRETVAVSGTGWFDHQWGPFYVTPIRNKNLEQYEWMSVQLDSGDELLLTTVWEANGATPSLPAYGGAGLIRANGTFDKLVGAERWKRTKFWRSPEQHAIYAAEWSFDAPEWGTSLTIRPRYHDQLTPLVDAPPPNLLGVMSRLFEGWANWLAEFWEGTCRVTGTFAGQPASGLAFAELVKRYEDPEFHIRLARSEPNLTVLEWRVANPDEQVPLRFRFFLEREDGTPIVDQAGLDIPVMVLDDPALPKNEPLIARVVASSLDGSLAGTDTLTVTLR